MLSLAVAGCGSSSDDTTTSAAPVTTAAPETTAPAGSDTTAATGGSETTVALTGDAATIAANWTQFFDGSQPVDGKADLLENGSQYTKELEAQAASVLAQAATVKVLDVKVTSDTTADVTYDLVVSGTPALPGQKGQAVKQDGVWKVSAASFQALLALQGASTGTTAGN
jgi:hypothetical protein